MKNLSKSTLLLIVILSSIVFFEIKEEIEGQRTFFLKRWFGNNYSYAKYLEIESFQLTDDQVAAMLANPQKKLVQPTLDELGNSEINVVIRIRNNGECTVKGRLREFFFQTDVGPIPGADLNKESPYYYIIFPYGVTYSRKNNPNLPEPLNFTWQYLYTE
jgi:hypothetical protein